MRYPLRLLAGMSRTPSNFSSAAATSTNPNNSGTNPYRTGDTPNVPPCHIMLTGFTNSGTASNKKQVNT